MVKDIEEKIFVELLRRSSAEIATLRKRNDFLETKAEAFDALKMVLDVAYRRGGNVGGDEDLVWTIDQFIKDLQENVDTGAAKVAGNFSPDYPSDGEAQGENDASDPNET